MKILLFISLLLYLSILAYVYFTQEDKIFNIAQIEEKEPFSPKDSKKIKLEVANGIFLDGLYKKSDRHNALLLIYFGGNSDDAMRFLLHVEHMQDFDIVVFNYRGYLKSGGVPSEKNLFSDSLKIYDTYANARKVVLVGRSLGTGVGAYLASKREVDGIILITPYDSIVSLAKGKYPFLPINLLLKYKFESIKHIQKTDAPIAVIEVKDDKIVPNTNTQKLLQKIKNLALHVELTNTTHTDILNYQNLGKIIKEAISKF